MINNFSLLEKSIFPTLLFEKMRCEINFHENRIFFSFLYFCTKYAILVNLIKRHKKPQLCQILIIIVGKYMKMDQYRGNYPSNSFLPHFQRLWVQSHCSGWAWIFCSNRAAYFRVISSSGIAAGLSVISSKRTV